MYVQPFIISSIYEYLKTLSTIDMTTKSDELSFAIPSILLQKYIKAICNNNSSQLWLWTNSRKSWFPLNTLSVQSSVYSSYVIMSISALCRHYFAFFVKNPAPSYYARLTASSWYSSPSILRNGRMPSASGAADMVGRYEHTWFLFMHCCFKLEQKLIYAVAYMSRCIACMVNTVHRP